MTREKALANYNNSYASCLYDVYGRYSHAKEIAFQRCIRRMIELDGHSGCIPTANSQTFTYAFLYSKGEKSFLCYITYAHEYHFEL